MPRKTAIVRPSSRRLAAESKSTCRATLDTSVASRPVRHCPIPAPTPRKARHGCPAASVNAMCCVLLSLLPLSRSRVVPLLGTIRADFRHRRRHRPQARRRPLLDAGQHVSVTEDSLYCAPSRCHLADTRAKGLRWMLVLAPHDGWIHAAGGGRETCPRVESMARRETGRETSRVTFNEPSSQP